jgi:CopG antitoxin of type II toxin-antitoxin system
MNEKGVKRPQTKSRIPEFSSREEEAAWWDRQNLADYQDEFKTVRASFAKNLSEGLVIRLDQKALTELRAEARRKGVGPVTLARIWILEHLHGTN